MALPMIFDAEAWDDQLDAERGRFLHARSSPSATELAKSSAIPRQVSTKHYRSSHHVMHASLQGAAVGVVMNLLPVLTASTPAQEAEAWTQLLKGVAVGAGVGAGIGGLQSVAKEVMGNLKPLILSMKPDGVVLKNILAIMRQRGSAMITTMSTAAFCVMESIGHLLFACVRSLQGNPTDARHELNAAWQSLKPPALIDNLAFVAASETANILVATLLPNLPAAIMGGVLAPAVPIIMYALGQGFAIYIHNKVDIRNTWVPWAKRMLGWELRLVWDSVNTPYVVGAINMADMTPPALNCAIDHSMVVEPVRHIGNGQLYEKFNLQCALRRNGLDPYSGIPATMKDYAPAPIAKRCAEQAAAQLGLRLISV